MTMTTLSFRLFGGYKVTFTDKDVTIHYHGEKFWIFTRAKARTKTIAYSDILRVDYKESGMTFGYVRLITSENEDYVSSSYVAEHDENAFMIEKDELALLNSALDLLKKHCKTIEFEHLKA